MSRILLWSVSALLVAVAPAQTPPLRKGVSVQMPVTTNAVAMPDADLADSLVVAVTARGAMYLEVNKVTPAQLAEKLRMETEAHPGKRVYLKADARTPYSTVAAALGALRAAGVNAPILLTAQHESTGASYVQPKGLEVFLQPAEPGSPTLKISSGKASDTELKRYAERDRAILLQAEGTTPFGDLVHAVDVCHAGQARVFLAAQ